MESTARKDKNGIILKDGDIVAECSVGDIIWDGCGIIEERPLGIVTVFKKHSGSKLLPPEETDCYNITQIRTGKVKLTDKAEDWMKKNLANGTGYSELHLSRYDGKFYAWDDVEIIGNIKDFSA